MPNRPTIPPTDPRLLDQILGTLKEGQSFCLSGHQNPDADVIGSELALASLIRRLGKDKRIDIQNSGPVPRSVSHLPGVEVVKNVKKARRSYDTVIVFECSGADRMGNIVDFATQAKTVVNIDHHLHNPNFGHINFVEPATSSTAELIFKIMERSGLPLLKEEAICLFSGMTADTGWFQYGNTNAQTHAIASKLLAAGVPVAELSERFYLSRSPAAVKLLAWVLSNMRVVQGGRVAIMRIPEQVFRRLGATGDDTEGIVNQGLLMESVRVSMLLKEKTNPPLIKVSLRSKGDTDINKVARAFGGGGHKNASGCSLSLSLLEAEKALEKQMRRAL